MNSIIEFARNDRSRRMPSWIVWLVSDGLILQTKDYEIEKRKQIAQADGRRCIFIDLNGRARLLIEPKSIEPAYFL